MYVEMVSGGQPFTAGRVCFFTLPPGYLSSKVSGLLTRGPIYEKSYEDLTNFLRLKKTYEDHAIYKIY